jgi:hypothetical protein
MALLGNPTDGATAPVDLAAFDGAQGREEVMEHGELVQTVAVALWEIDPDMTAPSEAIGRAERIIAAIEAQGLAVVPVEPTKAMVSAGIVERHEQPCPEAWTLATANIYRAMLAASPLRGEG